MLTTHMTDQAGSTFAEARDAQAIVLYQCTVEEVTAFKAQQWRRRRIADTHVLGVWPSGNFCGARISAALERLGGVTASD